MVPTGIEQPARPLHVPLQTPLPGQLPRIGAPETFPQVPAAVLLLAMPPQYWQVPLQALLQHTPSTQKFDKHWLAAVHACPCFAWHVPVESQVLVALQVEGSSAFVTATQVPPAPVQL